MRIVEDSDHGTRECPSCACEVPVNNNRCPVCGYLFPQPTPLQHGMRRWGGLLMLVLFLLLALGLTRWIFR